MFESNKDIDIINSEILEKMQLYARNNNVPIISRDKVVYLKKFLLNKKVKNILEIGTAIGYSALFFYCITKANIVTLEKDITKCLLANKFLNNSPNKNSIKIFNHDALDFDFNLIKDEKFDLIFIDASKKNNKKFFMHYSKYLLDGGYIITDNINFDKKKSIHNIKRYSSIFKSTIEYRTWLKSNSKFKTSFIEVGDGISISKKKRIQ